VLSNTGGDKREPLSARMSTADRVGDSGTPGIRPAQPRCGRQAESERSRAARSHLMIRPSPAPLWRAIRR